MSKTVLREREPEYPCGHMIDVSQGECRLYAICTRRRGHRDTGHEFVGHIGGEHVHIVWGEPEEVRGD